MVLFQLYSKLNEPKYFLEDVYVCIAWFYMVVRGGNKAKSGGLRPFHMTTSGPNQGATVVKGGAYPSVIHMLSQSEDVKC